MRASAIWRAASANGRRPLLLAAGVAIAISLVAGNTFSELRRRWPFPRSMFGRVIDHLSAAGAREIVPVGIPRLAGAGPCWTKSG